MVTGRLTARIPHDDHWCGVGCYKDCFKESKYHIEALWSRYNGSFVIRLLQKSGSSSSLFCHVARSALESGKCNVEIVSSTWWML